MPQDFDENGPFDGVLPPQPVQDPAKASSPLVALAKALGADGEYEMAAFCLTEAVEQGVPGCDNWQTAAEIAMCYGDLDVALQFSDHVAHLPAMFGPGAAATQGPRESLITMAARFAADNEVDWALNCVYEAIAGPSLTTEDRNMAAEVAFIGGDLDTAWDCWTTLIELEPWEPRWHCRLAITAEERTDYDAAREIITRGCERWPNDPWLQAKNFDFAAFYGRTNSSTVEALTLLENQQTSSLALLDASRWLLGVGKLAEARQALRRIPELSDDPDLRLAARVELRAIDILDEAGRELAIAAPGYLGVGREAVFQRTQNSETLAIVFSGLGGQFGVSVNTYHAIIQPTGASAVYLYDDERLLHLNGNRVLGRSYEATLQSLKKLIEAWNARRVVCIGNSAGGYAALRYGLELGAEHIVGFSAPTTLERDIIWNEGKARAVIKRMERYVSPLMIDLREMAKNRADTCRIDLYYGEDEPIDRARAERLGDLTNVSLHPVSDCGHHAVEWALLMQGELVSILREACSTREQAHSTKHTEEFPSQGPSIEQRSAIRSQSRAR